MSSEDESRKRDEEDESEDEDSIEDSDGKIRCSFEGIFLIIRKKLKSAFERERNSKYFLNLQFY